MLFNLNFSFYLHEKERKTCLTLTFYEILFSSQVEQDTGQSMANLEQLDRMKTELQLAKQALHEADNWTVLATDLEEVSELHIKSNVILFY